MQNDDGGLIPFALYVVAGVIALGLIVVIAEPRAPVPVGLICDEQTGILSASPGMHDWSDMRLKLELMKCAEVSRGKPMCGTDDPVNDPYDPAKHKKPGCL